MTLKLFFTNWLSLIIANGIFKMKFPGTSPNPDEIAIRGKMDSLVGSTPAFFDLK